LFPSISFFSFLGGTGTTKNDPDIEIPLKSIKSNYYTTNVIEKKMAKTM
jgi:hypothetical protein